MERFDFGSVNAENSALPAIDLYSGVLYQFLDFRTLQKSAQKRGDTEIFIFSDIFGCPTAI